MGSMFVLAYLSAMVRQAIESAGRVDLVGALIVAALTVAVGIGWLPFTANDVVNVGFWIGAGLLVWFLVMVLVVVPARHWRDHQGSAVPGDQPPQVINNFFIWPSDRPDATDTESGSQGVVVSPEDPQSPERSTHE